MLTVLVGSEHPLVSRVTLAVQACYRFKEVCVWAHTDCPSLCHLRSNTKLCHLWSQNLGEGDLVLGPVLGDEDLALKGGAVVFPL